MESLEKSTQGGAMEDDKMCSFTPGLEADANDLGEIKVDGSCLVHIPVPPEGSSFSQENITREEVLDYGNECFLLHSVLTKCESDHFIQEGEKLGFGSMNYAREDYRSSERTPFQSPELASLIWDRIKNKLEDIVIEGDPKDQHIEGPGFLLKGKWTPTGLNDVFRLCKYLPGGHFAPHYDGFFTASVSERSLKTFMLYLNGNFNGGSTNFVDPSQTLYKGPDGKYCAEEKNILHRVQPETGMAIVFNHHRLHEGERLQDNVKYILRTDIMYRNLSPSNLSCDQDKAIQMVQEADRLEAAGQCMEAMELYRRAFKLSPELAESYGF